MGLRTCGIVAGPDRIFDAVPSKCVVHPGDNANTAPKGAIQVAG